MATRYALGTTIRCTGDAPTPHTGQAYIEVIDLTESGSLGVNDPDARRALQGLAVSHATFAESYLGCIVGSVAPPERLEPDGAMPLGSPSRFGFYLDRTRLVLLDIDGPCTAALDELAEIELAPDPTPARALYELMRHLLKPDLQMLMGIEDELAEIEASIIGSDRRPREDAAILERRRDLMRLAGFYRQLMEMASDVAQDECDNLARGERRLFSNLSQQAERLESKASYLREYCMQLIELRQAQTARRRESTNLYLTVIASIFVPITTITGWYGMNFSNMPELDWEYGYAVVIMLSLVIIAGELAFFRWKKWL